MTANKTKTIFWVSLSLTFSALYGLMVLQKAFKSEYVVQDDARQHIFWMQRFVDGQLFPGDLIADYFQSLAPAGYSSFYRLMAACGIDPLLASKLLPPVLGLVATIYCFGCIMELLPVPLAGFVASLLLNQSLWMKFDLVSATPRAFLYPLFLAALYYLLRQELCGTCAAIALLGLFYPQLVLIISGVLVLRLVSGGQGLKVINLLFKNIALRLRLLLRFSNVRCALRTLLQSPNIRCALRSLRVILRTTGARLKSVLSKKEYRFGAIALLVAFAVILPYALKSSGYGPVITRAEAIAMPEFWPGGRSVFFNSNPIYFWAIGERSGILPPLLPPLIWLGIFLPILQRYPDRFPLIRQIDKRAKLLVEIMLVSLGLFFAAHTILFRLYLPSRYMEHSSRVVLALAASLVITILLDAAFQQIKLQPKPEAPPLPQQKKILSLTSILLLSGALVLYPAYTKSFPRTNYRPGRVAPLYQFFQQQPKDISIASLAGEANSLPTFSQRSILIGKEYALPYHVGYYRQFSQRVRDLIRAHYSPELAEVRNLIEKYGVDFWLVEREAFDPEYVAKNKWLQQYQPEASMAVDRLESGTAGAIARLMETCVVFETGNFVVLESNCLSNGE